VAYNVNIIGLDKVIAKFDKIPEQLQREIRGVVENGAKTFERNAKRDAPVNKEKDGGNLRQQITYYPLVSDKTKTTFEIVSGAKYSAYLEWGTITRVQVPAELQGYAIQFKGKGLRKTGGIIPQPYFFKQTPLVKKQIEADVRQVLDSL